jgi:hypothetical protein
MHRWKRICVAAVIALVVVAPGVKAAEAPIALGAADVYAVLAGTGITAYLPTTTQVMEAIVTGDVGTAPTGTIAGDITVHGTKHPTNDSQTQAAKVALAKAYQQAASRPVTAILPSELDNIGKGPGVYTSANGTFAIKNELVLDAQGNPNAVFIFKAPAGLTGNYAKVTLLNGAQACRVYWQTNTAFISMSRFAGTIMSENAITFDGSGVTDLSGQPLGTNTLEGRALAMNGSVRLSRGTYTRTSCPGLPDTGVKAEGSITIPLVVTLGVFSASYLAVRFLRRQRDGGIASQR